MSVRDTAALLRESYVAAMNFSRYSSSLSLLGGSVRRDSKREKINENENKKIVSNKVIMTPRRQRRKRKRLRLSISSSLFLRLLGRAFRMEAKKVARGDRRGRVGVDKEIKNRESSRRTPRSPTGPYDLKSPYSVNSEH